MLEMIIAPPGTGKTAYLTERMAQEAKNGRNVILLTPAQATHAMECRLVEEAFPQGLLNVQVLDMERLSRRILDETGGAAGEHLLPMGRMLAIHAAAKELEGDLSVYADAIRRTGFAARAAAQLEQLSLYDVSAEELILAADRVQEDGLKRKLRDIARIGAAVDDYLDAHGCAPLDALRLAAQQAKNASIVRDSVFFADGLGMPEPAALALFSALLQYGQGMTVTVEMDPAHQQQARFDSPRRMLAALRETAKACGCEVKETHLPAKEADDALSRLRGELFVYPGKADPTPTDAILLDTVSDPRREAEFTAEEILRLCREKDCRYRDITVLCADEATGFVQLRRAFEKHGIAAFYDCRRPVLGSAAEILVRLADAGAVPWRSEEVLPILKSGLTPVSPEDAWKTENWLLAHGGNGAARWKRPFRGADAQIAENVRQTAVKLFSDYFDAMTGTVPARERVEAVFAVLEKMQTRMRLENLVVELQGSGANEEAAVTAQVWKILMETLGQISHVMGDELLTAREFALLVREGLGAAELGIIPTTLDQVTVSTPGRWNADGGRVVFLIGATDAALSPVSESDALLDDGDVLTLLSEAELSVGQNPRYRAGEFKFRLYRVLCAAREKLYVTCPMRDMAGEPTGVSHLFSHLSRLFPNAARIGKNDLPADAEDGFARWVRAMQHGKMTAQAKAAEAWLLSSFDWREKTLRVRQMRDRDGEPVLSAELAAQLFPEGVRMSVTQLERFAACPFAHFAAYALRVHARDEFEAGDRAESGTVVHEMLRRLGEDVLTEKVDLFRFDEPACRAWTEDSFAAMEQENDYLASLSQTASGRAIRDRLVENVFTAAVNFTHSITASSFRLAAVEQELPSVELSCGARLSGRLDRVDIAPLADGGLVRTADYKSSAKNTDLSEIYYGRRLQLAVYLAAVCRHPELYDKKTLTPAAMLYFPIGDRADTGENFARMEGIVNADDAVLEALDHERTESGRSLLIAPASRGAKKGRVTGREMELLLDYALSEADALARRATAGEAAEFPAYGKDERSRACTYCDHRDACGFENRTRPLSARFLREMADRDALLAMEEEKDAHEGTTGRD